MNTARHKTLKLTTPGTRKHQRTNHQVHKKHSSLTIKISYTIAWWL